MLQTATLQRIPPVAARRYPLRSVVTRPRPIGDQVAKQHHVLVERIIICPREGAMRCQEPEGAGRNAINGISAQFARAATQ
jgi:hypothetical protein